MSVQNTLSPDAAQSPVSHEDIARVLGRHCLIRLDNGAESFWHNGHYVCEADGAFAEAGVADIARLAARAGGQSLRHAELPVPDGEWCWSDIAERLARSALTETVRASGIVTGCETPQGRGVHFCDHPLLSGDNSNLWFPVGSGESWFEAVERILTMNVSVLSRPSSISARVSYHGHFREQGHYRGQKHALHQ